MPIDRSIFPLFEKFLEKTLGGCAFQWIKLYVKALSATKHNVIVYYTYMYYYTYYSLSIIMYMPLQDIEQDMLPEACVQRVEEYKDRLVNFNARRRKSSIGLSPVTILLSRGVHVFPEDTRSTSSSSNTRSVLHFIKWLHVHG